MSIEQDPTGQDAETLGLTARRQKSELILEVSRGEADGRAMARAATSPSYSAALAIRSIEGSLWGGDTSMGDMLEYLRDSMKRVNAGDLTGMEAMLTGQATALQAIFASLMVRANEQKTHRNFEGMLNLALKAQSQSRSTIAALVDLKYPRQQATFVKQANINNGGQQQVNNGVSGRLPDAPAHGEEKNEQNEQNKLLEANHGGTYVDTGAARAATRGDPAMAALEALDRAKNP